MTSNTFRIDDSLDLSTEETWVKSPQPVLATGFGVGIGPTFDLLHDTKSNTQNNKDQITCFILAHYTMFSNLHQKWRWIITLSLRNYWFIMNNTFLFFQKKFGIILSLGAKWHFDIEVFQLHFILKKSPSTQNIFNSKGWNPSEYSSYI